MLLKARIKNVMEWKAIINAISDLVEEAMFICNIDGITFRGMDSSHIAILDVTFPLSSFDHLESKTSFFGLRVDDFKKILNTIPNDDILEIQINDPNMMKVSIYGSLNMEYNIKLLERKEVNTSIPKIDYTSKMSLDTGTLIRILSNIQQISEYVIIHCQNDRVEFSGKGDAGDAKINLEKGNPDLEKLESSSDTRSVYSLQYMAQIIRDIGRASKRVNMECSTHNPIHMMFEMPSMTRVEYYLAPRIEN